MGRILTAVAIGALLAAMATSTGAVVMGSHSTVVGSTTIEGGTSTTSIPGVWLASQSAANLTAPAVTNAVAARADEVADTPTSIVTVTGVVCDVKDGSTAHCVTPVPTTVTVTTVTRTDWSGALKGLPTASEGRCDKNFEFSGLTLKGSSPLILDCIELAYRISGPGEWHVMGTGGFFHKVVACRTCAFGMNSWGEGPPVVLVGNQDIIDLIRDSIMAFAAFGRVEAKGRLLCTSQVARINRDVDMEWQIYCSYGGDGCTNYEPFPDD